MSHLVLVDVVLVFVVLLPSYAPSPVPVDLFDDPPPRLPHTTSGFARVPPIFAKFSVESGRENPQSSRQVLFFGGVESVLQRTRPRSCVPR